MTSNGTTHNSTATLLAYLGELTADEPKPRPEDEPWSETIERITTASGSAEIDAETYFWFLEVLPPRFMLGSYFCFAEGIEPFRLFWRCHGRYFVRVLDWRQTKNLCRLAGIPAYE